MAAVHHLMVHYCVEISVCAL